MSILSTLSDAVTKTPAGGIVSGLVTILASPGGVAILDKLFAEHGMTQDKIDQTAAGLKKTRPPKQ